MEHKILEWRLQTKKYAVARLKLSEQTTSVRSQEANRVDVYPPGLEAKSVSLNDIIAAERAAKQPTTSRATTLYTLTGIQGKTQTQEKKTSPLKYRQTFQIKSPSKPKKFKLSPKTRYKRKNSLKREINYDDGIIPKYIPLLKNLRLLVDDILGSESSETYEPRGRKFKRDPSSTNERDNIVCTCRRKSDSKSTSQEKTITSTPALASAVTVENIATTIATTTKAYITVNDNVRGIRRYKNLPVLSTRNSTSVWRNDSGLGQGSGSSFNRSFERYIARDNRNNQCNTGRKSESHTENYEEYTDSYSRNDASCDRSSEQLRGLRFESRNTEDNRGTDEIEESTIRRSETFEDVGRNLSEHEREVEFKIPRNETESSLSIPKFTTRLRGFESKEKDTSLRISQEIDTQNSASYKQISNRDGSFASKNQGISAANEPIVSKHSLPNSTFPIGKAVMIFDGYSVARDVNGDNKLTEKAIQIHA